MAKKIDGVIEAVRYKNGQILMVRAYERRGAAFSDLVLLDRKMLLERLQNGKQFMTGTREEFLAGTFKTGKSLMSLKQDDRELIATYQSATHDELQEVPAF